MATYSVYNIKVDNLLSFTPGPTAGYVLAIDSNGNTYWSAGGSGGGSGSSGSNGTSGSSGTSGLSGLNGTSGSSGSSGTSGVNGLNGYSSNLFLYEAETSIITGNPGSGHILWNNATQISATQININHLTDDPIVDIDIFLALLNTGQTLTIQDRNNSANYQIWTITSTPTLIAGVSNYWEVPVSLISSAGTGTTNFSNNHELFLSIVAQSGSSGTSGSSGVNGATGPSGGGTLAQTLALGNNVGTYSIIGTSSLILNVDNNINSSVINLYGDGIIIDSPVVSFSANPVYELNLPVNVSFPINGLTSSLLAVDANGKIIATSSVSTSNTGSFGITIDGGGSVITTGIKGYVSIPYNATIDSWTIMADQTGSIVIDIWKDNYANFPPLVADTIAGTEKPTLSSAIINQDTNLTTWTTSITTGDIIGFNVDSASTLTRVNLAINITKI